VTQDQPVWADVWNPDVNEWSPSNEPEGTYGLAEPSHGDVALAEPLTEPYGGPSSGTVPAPGLNLLTDVAPTGAPAAPPQMVRHDVEVHTYESGAELIRARTIPVVGTTTVTRILDPNPDRRRALIKVATATATVQIGAIDQLNPAIPQTNATPTSPTNTYFLDAIDGVFDIKSADGVDALGVAGLVGNIVYVSVWEELNAPSHDTGALS